MNVLSVNASSNVNVDNNAKQNSNLQSTFTKGEVIDGLITKVSDEISITFSGKEVKASKSAVQNAKEGEIRRFEIMDVSEKSIVLKEVGSSTSGMSQSGIVCTTVETDQATFTEQLMSASEENWKEEDTQAAKEKLEDIANRMTKEDYIALQKEGISLELYELERLTKALERIKTQRAFKEEGSARQVEKIEEKRETVEKVSVGVKYGSLADEIEQKLEEADLPVTLENIKRIENALKMASAASSMSNHAMAYLIDNELAPTAQNVYKAKYSGDYSNTKKGYQVSGEANYGISEEAWQQIKKQAETVIAKAGMEVTESGLNNARWIIENNLALTEGTLGNLEKLTNLKLNYKQEDTLNIMIDAYSKGVDPEQVSLADDTYAVSLEAVNAINQISDEAIIKVVQEQKELTLGELKKAEKEVTVKNHVLSDMNIQEITAKRQIEEIRLKLTVDSAQVLIKNGMNLDTTELQNIVEGLREQENQYYRNLLQESDVVGTEENIALLRETTEKVNELKTIPYYILGTTLQTKDIQTLDMLCTSGNALKSTLDKAGETYESLMTTPRKDLGDSIQKAFRNIDSLLENMNIETTDANRRAVRILGYNNMEILEEAIAKVKSYDSQVSSFIKNLHPAMTVNMIQQGINPLNTPIVELNSKITDMKVELGITDEIKYSKYLWQLEKKEGISEEERKTFIGIYRLLNNISKTDGAAIGSVLQADQEVTLNNLLTAVKTMKSGGINKKVDDDFGVLESLTFTSETIANQLDTTYGGTTKKNETVSAQDISEEVSYLSQVVTDILDTISPDALIYHENTANANLSEIMNTSLEKLKEDVIKQSNEAGQNTSYEQEMVEQVRALTEHSEEAIRFLVEYELPVNVNNLMVTSQFIKGENSFFKQIKDQATRLTEEDNQTLHDTLEGFVDALKDYDSIQEQYNKLEKGLSSILQKGYENATITSDDLKNLKMLGNGMELVKSLSQSRYYEVPVTTGDSITSMNVRIISGTGDTGKVKLHYNSEDLGQIDGVFSLKGTTIKGLILSDNRDGLEMIKKNQSFMEENLQSQGLELNQLDFATNKRIQDNFIDMNSTKANETNSEETGSSTTTDLLHIAQLFIKCLKISETRK